MAVPADWPDGIAWQAKDAQNQPIGPIYIRWKETEYVVTEDLFLVNIEVWDENWADYVFWSEGVRRVTQKHWDVITFLRDYFRQFGSIPTIRVVVKGLGIKLMEIYELFPSGPSKGACRAAGTPRPTGCLA